MSVNHDLIRINRYLYLKNICSRREADRLIEKGLIFVNGKKAKLGQKISENDNVDIKKEALQKLKNKIIIILNKPKNYVSANPQGNEKEANNLLPFSEKLSPVGRLDKNSHGLLLLTNDGRIVNKLLNPDFDHDKEYIVKVDKRITPTFLNQIKNGVNIEGYITKKTKIKKIDSKTFSLILTEGKKHQIKRMCQALGYTVIDLQRTRILNLKLNNLEIGKYRKIEGKEYLNFMEYLK
ncbi:MAG: rRNA pseudouridine synthase [Candidatus Pacebacteria bacterium]|nr:rRNA pseudouridine synthase [Candidatus Paceibacterota bacterium]